MLLIGSKIDPSGGRADRIDEVNSVPPRIRNSDDAYVGGSHHLEWGSQQGPVVPVVINCGDIAHVGSELRHNQRIIVGGVAQSNRASRGVQIMFMPVGAR